MSDAALIAALLAVDPGGLGGVWVRARHGARRDALMRALGAAGPSVQIRPGMDPQALFGGVDLTASLAEGRIVETRGMVREGALLCLAQAERIRPALASQLAARIDAVPGSALMLQDEGTDDDALPPAALRERAAFFLHEGSEAGETVDVGCAQARLAEVAVPEAIMSDAVTVAARLGIAGLRPVIFAVAAARAHAALNRRKTVEDADLAVAAELVFGHRAAPVADAPEEPEPPPPAPSDAEGESSGEGLDAMADVVLEAARTALPAGVLAALAVRSRLAQGSGEGLARLSDTRGRPLPARPGRLDGRRRIDLLATLQAAAPWQKIRGREGQQLRLRPDDIRLKRYRDRSERLLIFAVDASGSAAMARLAEAKGAAETLLAEAYENRDKVCLTVFRDRGAEVIVPPTRSLTRAKRLLSAMPAGGATPLAAGLSLAADLAEAARRSGQAAQVILMTDGRANRALDGSTDRARAEADAARAAARLGAAQVPVVVLDSGRRVSRHLSDLAGRLGADLVPLPRLGAALARTNVDA